MKNTVLYSMIFFINFSSAAQAGEHSKENLQKRISLMQQDLAQKIAIEAKERDYGFKIFNESGLPLTISVTVGTPQKFNSVIKLKTLYNKESLESSTAQVILTQKWPLKIQIMDQQQRPLILTDNKHQPVAEFILDLEDAISYLAEKNGLGTSYHFYIRKPLKKNIYEILTPKEYQETISTIKRWSYENKPKW